MKIKGNSLVKQIISYGLLFLAITSLCVIGNLLNTIHIKNIQQGMLLLILAAFAVLIYRCYKRTFQYKYIFVFSIFSGIVMRIGYMLYTPYVLRAHDIGAPVIPGGGHAGYILWLFQKGQLPDTNAYLYYHPPLYHFLSAIMLRIGKLLTGISEVGSLLEMSKVISCFASCVTLIVVYQLCRELELKDRAVLIVMVIASFLPNMYLLAGRVNNDSLAVLFMMIIILYTVKWYRVQNIKNVVILAFAFGLGMMTKVSCGILAAVTGSIMIIVWIKHIKAKNGVRIFTQLLAFGGICFPLALWYPIRNFLMFGQPLAYVYEISKAEDIYCGDIPIVQRFLIFPLKQILFPLYNRPFEDHNVILYTIKGSLFGEFSFDINGYIPALLILINTGFMILSLGAMVYVVLNKSNHNRMLRFGIPGFWGVIWISYLLFNLRYPFGCTMDFRYIVPVAILGAIMLGTVYGQLQEDRRILVRLCQLGIQAALILFTVLSIIMFCFIKR